ncbi:WhiB family transcriptional regulator [Streptomyces phaeochromogenes]|uniref:WhiB family transcriptional regulator n=1 Tax=Streptomyces phaeochromogenes TaxID=1923 RepID=UPI0036C4E8F0
MKADLSWMDAALCAQTDPELFHPEGKGCSYRDARSVCGACPVQPQCQAYAAQFEGDASKSQRHGMWGARGPQVRARNAKGAAA